MHFIERATAAAVSVGFVATTLLAGCAAEDQSTQRGTMSFPGTVAPTGGAGATGASGAGGGAAGTGSFGNPTGLPAPAITEPVSSGSANGCEPGHYVGAFDGTYNSASWGNGSFPLSIEAVASMGQPGLEFWLERTEAECTNSEFCADFTVKGGKIRGFANPFSDPNAPDGGAANPFAIAVRFEIDFGGELDCGTGEFKGLLQNGCYDVATRLYRFDGTAPATYDQATKSFTQGQWTATEMAMPGVLFPPDAKIGGMGVWDAALVDDGSSAPAAGAGLCDM